MCDSHTPSLVSLKENFFARPKFPPKGGFLNSSKASALARMRVGAFARGHSVHWSRSGWLAQRPHWLDPLNGALELASAKSAAEQTSMHSLCKAVASLSARLENASEASVEKTPLEEFLASKGVSEEEIVQVEENRVPSTQPQRFCELMTLNR